MAKGTEEKEIIKNKILETFPQAFVCDKEIRVPINDVEIKISFVCAKDVIGGGNQVQSNIATPASASVEPPTEAEVKEVRNLIEELGL